VILYLPRSLLTSIEYPIGVVGKKREETGAGGGSLGSNEQRSRSKVQEKSTCKHLESVYRGKGIREQRRAEAAKARRFGREVRTSR
jgi:hypothetical protein